MAIHQEARVEPEYTSLREAARTYAVSAYTLRRRIASGDLAGRQARLQDHPCPDRRPRRALPYNPDHASRRSIPPLVIVRPDRFIAEGPKTRLGCQP